jgi:hypothetical protein
VVTPALPPGPVGQGLLRAATVSRLLRQGDCGGF